MEEQFVEENVKSRLILSGIKELEDHGLTDFSLRRAAVAAQVSCAAPYRHFKDKEEYISEIIKYVNSRWELLSCEIERIHSSDPARLAYEMSIAALRFRIANKNFRSVFNLAATAGHGELLDRSLILAIKSYCLYKNISDKETEHKVYTVRAFIAGTLMLLGDDVQKVLSNAQAFLLTQFK